MYQPRVGAPGEECHPSASAGLKRESSLGVRRGGAVQTQPWLESTTSVFHQSLIAKKDTQCFQLEPLCTTRFQSLIAKNDTQCFQLEPLVSSLRLYTGAGLKHL